MATVTRTIKPAGGGDYTTLAAAYAARKRNLVTAQEIEVWECYAGDVGALPSSLTGFTTSSSYYLKITAAAEARHAGVWDVAKAHSIGAGGAMATDGTARHIKLCCMLIRFTSGSDAMIPYSSNNPADFTVDECVFDFTGTTRHGIYGPANVHNVISYNYAGSGYCYNMSAPFTGCELFNITAIGTGNGFRAASSTTLAKNCVAHGFTDGFVGTFAAGSDYNISSVASDAPGGNSKQGTVQFLDATNKNYHLSAADSAARGAGTNLTASGITTDIDGTTRPAAGAWDAGADHYVAAATSKDPWGKKPWGRYSWNRARWKAAA
jgi:hypothetical protein